MIGGGRRAAGLPHDDTIVTSAPVAACGERQGLTGDAAVNRWEAPGREGTSGPAPRQPGGGGVLPGPTRGGGRRVRPPRAQACPLSVQRPRRRRRMASTRPPGTYSPSARTGRRGGESWGVAGMVRRAGSDALPMSLRSTAPVGQFGGQHPPPEPAEHSVQVSGLL